MTNPLVLLEAIKAIFILALFIIPLCGFAYLRYRSNSKLNMPKKPCKYVKSGNGFKKAYKLS